MEEPPTAPLRTEGRWPSPFQPWYRISHWLKGAPNDSDICGCSSLSLQGAPSRVSVEATLSKICRLQAVLYSRFALRNWRVRTVIHALSAMQHPPSLVVVHCGASQENSDKNIRQAEELGGYSPQHNTVWICGNRLWSPFNFRRVLLHELLHAFDFARAKLDTSNCEHIACTEIRAINLSEQCGLWASRSLSAKDLESPLDADSIANHSAQKIRKLQQEAARAKILSDEAEAASADAARAAAKMSTVDAVGEGKTSSAAMAALAKAERLLALAAASTKAAKDADQAATEATNGVPPWQASKRNACVAKQARLSTQRLQQCRQPGVADSAVASVFSKCLADTWPFEHPPEFDSRLRPSRIYADHAETLISS